MATNGSSSGSKEQWASRVGMILAVAGSAVGLGNFLRFPGQVAANGGGVFMIPYFIAFLLIGIPVCWAEWTLGRFGGRFGFHSTPAVFGLVGKRSIWRYLGVIGVVIPLVIYMYYVVIESWCLGYAFSYLFGWIDLGSDPALYADQSKAFFSRYTGLAADGDLFSGGFTLGLATWILVYALNFFLIYRGLSKGVESFCKVAVPFMAISALIVLIRVLTLGTPQPEHPELNVLNGLGYMWNPKPMHVGESWWQALANADVWLAATGQIFFSLSVGFGIIVNYASYLRRNDDVILSGLTSSATNEFFEVCLGGMITIPAAFIFLGAAGASGGTFGLGFNTLPIVFLYMPGGQFFGFLWFFMLFLAAVTSSISMLQPVIAFLMEGLGVQRRAAVALLGIITMSGSFFVQYFSKDLAALDTMDFWVGTALIFVLATIQVILFGWVFGVKKGMDEAQRGAELKLPGIFPFIIKYVSPVYLLTIFVFWCTQNLPSYIDSLAKGGVPFMTVCFLAGLLLFFGILVNIAGRRWSVEKVLENKL